eukprot:6173489-Pleurochrysis_carterae.AAC.2
MHEEKLRREGLHKMLESRRSELELLRKQDSELAASEAQLTQRLWEVQETRRRQAAMVTLMQKELSDISSQLAGGSVATDGDHGKQNGDTEEVEDGSATS